MKLALSYGKLPYSHVVHDHWLGALPQTAERILFGCPNNDIILSELMPWCTFNIFSVVNEEGKADIGLVIHDVSVKVVMISKDNIEILDILVVPLFI